MPYVTVKWTKTTEYEMSIEVDDIVDAFGLEERSVSELTDALETDPDFMEDYESDGDEDSDRQIVSVKRSR